MGLGYAWEKLHVAVLSLVGPGDLASRLEWAFVGSLIRIQPENDLPPDLQRTYAEIKEALTSAVPQSDEGSVHASILAMDESTMVRLSEKIVSLYDAVVRIHSLEREGM